MSPTGETDLDVNANDVLAFFVEIGVLVLLAVAGWRVEAALVLRVALTAGLPVVAALLWGAFAAPRARVRSGGLRLATKLLVLGSGVVAGFLVLPFPWDVFVGLVVTLNLLLMYVGPLARRPLS